MKTYETLFIAAPTLTEEEERAAVERLSAVVQDGGGTMVAAERMGRRRLAYPIQRHQDGVYVRFLYDSDPAVPRELERRIRLSDQILRSLTVHLEDNWAAAAKRQAVLDAEARELEARERERLEREAIEAGRDPSTVRLPSDSAAAAAEPTAWDSGDDVDGEEDR